MNYITRQFRVRDAVLAYAILQAAEGARRRLVAADVGPAVKWSEDPELSEDEVRAAAQWLDTEGYISAKFAFGGEVLMMTPTAKGERTFADGASVRDDADRPSRVATPYVVISNNQGAAIAVNSAGASQTVTNRDSFQAARDVARLIERSASKVEDQGLAAEARSVAAEIDTEVEKPQPDPGKIKALMFKAGTALAGSFGTTIGTELAGAAMQAHALF